MDALNNAIGFEHEKTAAGGHFHDAAIIARTCDDRFPERKTRQKLVEQSVLAEMAQFHCRKVSGNASTVSVSELNSECIVMATRIEPLHS